MTIENSFDVALKLIVCFGVCSFISQRDFADGERLSPLDSSARDKGYQLQADTPSYTSSSREGKHGGTRAKVFSHVTKGKGRRGKDHPGSLGPDP